MVTGPSLGGTFELAKKSISRFSSYFESCEMMRVMIIVLLCTAVPRNNHHHHSRVVQHCSTCFSVAHSTIRRTQLSELVFTSGIIAM
jgi:hypothetical protein